MLENILDLLPKTSPGATPDKGASAGTSSLTQLASKGFAAAMAALAPQPGGGGGAQVAPSGLQGLAGSLIAQGMTDENKLTNELFYSVHPELRDMKLKAGSQEAAEWLQLRDTVARPALRTADEQKSKGEHKGAEPGGTPTPDGPAPVGPKTPAGTSGKGDAYYNQNDNSYDDGLADWKGGSAGKNTCNMTALTMALVSLAGSEAAARTAVVNFLKKEGVRSGAKAKVGGKSVSMTKALGDPKLEAQVQLEDLVIAAAVSITNSYSGVTSPNTILKVAKKVGLAKGGEAHGSEQKLYDPETLNHARELVAAGQRIVVGTKGHYVYLTEVRGDGIVVHDPAGARVALDGDKNLWPGTMASKLGTWLGRLGSEERRATLIRRMSTSQAKGPMEEVARIATLKGAEKTAAKDELKAAETGFVETGANNFYSLEDLKTYNARIRVVLEGQPDLG